jgi:hypothetical protein
VGPAASAFWDDQLSSSARLLRHLPMMVGCTCPLARSVAWSASRPLMAVLRRVGDVVRWKGIDPNVALGFSLRVTHLYV